jgi:hypothetical protein
VPRTVVAYLSRQLEVESVLYLQYDWQGRSIKYHRSQIRQFLGFRQATLPDLHQMTNWLTHTLVKGEQRVEMLKAAAYQRWREFKIEPPTPDQVERMIRSVLHAHEENCFDQIFQRLPLTTLKELDTLLDEGSDSEVANSADPVSADFSRNDGLEKAENLEAASPARLATSYKPSFQQLKNDATGPNLKSVLKETAKLKCLRAVSLSQDLFRDVCHSPPTATLSHSGSR